LELNPFPGSLFFASLSSTTREVKEREPGTRLGWNLGGKRMKRGGAKQVATSKTYYREWEKIYEE